MMAVLAIAACGGEDTIPPSDDDGGPAACEMPNRVIDDRCVEPGFQDNGCAAGTVLQDDGSCLDAGVESPPECGDGQMAAVGETVCAPIMECGAGPWGDLPTDGTTQHVDGSFAGASNGSAAAPWTTIGEALTAAAPGALVAVAAGNYLEDVNVSGKPVRLWGVCPDAVTLTGVGTPATLNIGGGADGSEIGGMTITGPDIGVLLSGSLDVVVDRVWIRDNASRGIDAEGAFGATSLTVRHSLIDSASEFGVFVAGADVSLDSVVVRDTRPLGASLGRGVNAKSSLTGDTVLSMVDSVVERSADIGVLVASAAATLERVVVRQSGADGAGFRVDNNQTAPSVVSVGHSLFEANRVTGIWTASSEVSFTGVVVRDTLPREADLAGGRGLSVEVDPVTLAPSNVTVVGSLFERNTNISLFVGASVATLDGVVTRATFPNASDGKLGRGINIENDITTGAPSFAIISGSLVEQNAEISLGVLGSEAHIVGTHVLSNLPQLAEQVMGRGINIQTSISNFVPSTATVTSSLVESSADTGLFVSGANVEADAIVVRDTIGQPDGTFGDGVLATAHLGPTTLALRRSLVENSMRSALSNFGSHIILESTTLQCQAFDIATEPLPESTIVPTFENLGGNTCGCPATDESCKAESAGLVPPAPVQ